MRHYFDTVFNTSGGPVEGVKVRLTDAGGNAVPIFSDDGGTRLAGDTAISNARGLFEFYVPFATYNLNYYSPSEALLQVIPNVYMGSDATDALLTARDDAAAAASAALISEQRSALSQIATAEDVVATTADVVLTHADATATAADRVYVAASLEAERAAQATATMLAGVTHIYADHAEAYADRAGIATGANVLVLADEGRHGFRGLYRKQGDGSIAFLAYVYNQTGVVITAIAPPAAGGVVPSDTPTIEGYTSGISQVNIYVDNVFATSVFSDLNGFWQATLPNHTDGAVSIVAVAFPATAPEVVTIAELQAFAYEAETTALVAAFTTPPTKRRKDTINWAIKTLKARGVWSKIIGLWRVGQDSQSSLINWKTPGTYNLVASSGGLPTFLPNVGFANFSVTKYLKTGITLDTIDPGDCYLGYFPISAGGLNGCGALDAAGKGLALQGRLPADLMPYGAAGGARVQLDSTASAWLNNRWCAVGRLPSDSGNVRVYRTATNMKSTANAAAGGVGSLGAVEITFGVLNNNGTLQIDAGEKAWVIAKGLTDAEQTVLAGVMQAIDYDFQFGELDCYEAGSLPTSGTYDVIVYGCTSAGCMAAYEAKRQGLSVAMVGGWRDHRGNFGGMSAGGLGATDWFAARSTIGGLPGWLQNQVSASLAMECEKFRYKLTGMFDPRITGGLDIPVYWSTGVVSAKTAAAPNGRSLTSFITADGRTFTANVSFIDASYESDLLRVSGITLVYGREAATGSTSESRNGWAGLTSDTTSQYRGHQVGAPMNVDPWIVPGDPTSGLLPYIESDIAAVGLPVGAADGRTQGYNFRISASDGPASKQPFSTMPAPPGYDPANFEALSRWLGQDPLIAVADLFNPVVTGPDGLRDWNNHNGISTDMPGSGTRYQQAATYAEREIVWKEAENYVRGIIYHVASSTDPRVTGSVVHGELANTYGFHTLQFVHPHPNDDFNWMPQLYIRTMYRMLGDYVHTGDDVLAADGTVPRSTKTIAIGAYYMDTHMQHQYADNSTGTWRIWKEGNVDVGIDWAVNVDKITPFPMEVLFPKRQEMQNLISAWGISGTQQAMSVFRMEFTAMLAGQAAGIIAKEHSLLAAGTPVQDVSYASVRARLLASPSLVGEVAPILPQVN